MDIHAADVSLSLMVFSSLRFRISRPGPSPKLCESVARFGVLEPPVLVSDGERFIPMTGHNRLEAAKRAGLESVRCLVCAAPEYEAFVSRAALRTFRGELGVIGRVRAASIAASLKGVSSADEEICALLELPLSIVPSIEKILALHESMLSYFDAKSVPQKTVLMVTSFPSAIADALRGWIAASNVRMNMFKSAVDLLDDLLRVKTQDELCSMITMNESASDDALVSALYALRNPVISQMNEKAGALCAEFKRHQIELVYPPFFEGSAVEVKLRMMRSDGGASCRKGIEHLLQADFSRILGFL